MPSPTDDAVLAWVRTQTTPTLVRTFLHARDAPNPTADAVQASRWLALATLGELFARGAAGEVPEPKPK